ncbi:MAG TPA: endo-1,4-beta-xylanase [Solirubrobacteraceae bacterium]
MRSQDPSANSLSPLTADPRYLATFLGNFDSLTPENELKMLFTEPTEGTFDFAPADSLVSLAAANGKQVRGHTLIWSDELPAWLTNPLLPWSPGGLLDVMRQYITTVMQHYGRQIDTWDVVNEAFQDDGSYTQSVWYDVLGPSYIADAYAIAHQADPAAKLFYNDIGAEANNPKQQAILSMVNALRAQGVEIDGIGMENHTNAPGYPTDPQLEQTMSQYAQLGLRVEITEMDVETQGTAPADALTAQADAYRAAATACWDVAACDRFTTWGFSDAVSWVGAQQAADLFDTNFQPKPAFAAVDGALFRGAFAPPVPAAARH